MTSRTISAYTGGTASMQVVPEALHVGEAASETSLDRFPIETARCATPPDQMEWVPDREQAVVPPLMAALCHRCPGRRGCLLWALAGREEGYWAGSTTADRARMLAEGRQSITAADELQAYARAAAIEGALHPEGEGSYWWYRRRGCRCAECRGHNADARASERAKARDRQQAA